MNDGATVALAAGLVAGVALLTQHSMHARRAEGGILRPDFARHGRHDPPPRYTMRPGPPAEEWTVLDTSPVPPRGRNAPTRDEAIAAIKDALKRRSGRTWSVRGGRGTAWSWITVTAPPARQNQYGGMSKADQDELSRLLGEEVHDQGVSIPASAAYYRAYIERAMTGTTSENPQPYWD